MLGGQRLREMEEAELAWPNHKHRVEFFQFQSRILFQTGMLCAMTTRSEMFYAWTILN
jgi:hypothetical protein